MSEMHLKQPVFTYSACGLYVKKEFKDLKKQKIQDILIRTTKHAFSLIWLIVF